jgi:hypothetical protein
MSFVFAHASPGSKTISSAGSLVDLRRLSHHDPPALISLDRLQLEISLTTVKFDGRRGLAIEPFLQHRLRPIPVAEAFEQMTEPLGNRPLEGERETGQLLGFDLAAWKLLALSFEGKTRTPAAAGSGVVGLVEWSRKPNAAETETARHLMLLALAAPR